MRSVVRSGRGAATVVRTGGWQCRLGPWRTGTDTAILTPLPGGPATRAEHLRTALRSARAHGYDDVITPALAPADQPVFLAAGFELREELHLLQHDLLHLQPVPDATLRRPRRSEWAQMADVDARAFDAFWHLDVAGIGDACRATPSTRLRIATTDSNVSGYAVCGRSGPRGYVQRLAVDPSVAGLGLGSALLLDGLHWLADRGVRSALVNTQLKNERALTLYERHGFRLLPSRLAVLGSRLDHLDLS